MGVSIVFLLMLKIILTASDLIMSLIVYKMVLDKTGDERKAVIAFLLVFICPHVLGSSSIIVMPDTLSALFTVLTIVLLKEDRYFFAGVCYSIAVWVKFFPIAIILVLLCYIYIEAEGDDRLAVKRFFLSVSGFLLMSLIIFIPQIMEGTVLGCLSFLTDRIDSILSGGILRVTVAVLAALLVGFVSLHVARHMLTMKSRGDDKLMEYSLILLSVCMVLYTNVQYLVTLMPFLVYCMMVVDRNYRFVWGALAVAGLCLALMLNTNAVMLNSLVAYTNMISADVAVSLFNILNNEIIAGLSLTDIFCAVGNLIQKLSLFLILLVFIIRRVIARRNRVGEHHE